MSLAFIVDELQADEVRALIERDCPTWGDRGRLAKRIGVSPQLLSAVLCGHKAPCGKILAHYGLERRVLYVRKAGGNA